MAVWQGTAAVRVRYANLCASEGAAFEERVRSHLAGAACEWTGSVLPKDGSATTSCVLLVTSSVYRATDAWRELLTLGLRTECVAELLVVLQAGEAFVAIS